MLVNFLVSNINSHAANYYKYLSVIDLLQEKLTNIFHNIIIMTSKY